MSATYRMPMVHQQPTVKTSTSSSFDPLVQVSTQTRREREQRSEELKSLTLSYCTCFRNVEMVVNKDLLRGRIPLGRSSEIPFFGGGNCCFPLFCLRSEKYYVAGCACNVSRNLSLSTLSRVTSASGPHESWACIWNLNVIGITFFSPVNWYAVDKPRISDPGHRLRKKVFKKERILSTGRIVESEERNQTKPNLDLPINIHSLEF